MQLEKKIGNATLNVTFHDHDPEFAGECLVELNKKMLFLLYKCKGFNSDYMDDEQLEYAGDDDESSTVTISSADQLIFILAAARDSAPMTWEIDYYGAPYWFFHDLDHAENDCDDGMEIFVDDSAEMRALVDGAKNAVTAGCSASGVITELANIRKDFSERFGFDFDPVEEFLDCCELKVM